MLHKCANPSCLVRFRSLRRGKLFQIESDFPRALAGRSSAAGSYREVRFVRRVERYWLCDECAAAFTLSFDLDGVVTIPLPHPAKQEIHAMQPLAQLDRHGKQLVQLNRPRGLS